MPMEGRRENEIAHSRGDGSWRRPVRQTADLSAPELRGPRHSSRRGRKDNSAARLSRHGAGDHLRDTRTPNLQKIKNVESKTAEKMCDANLLPTVGHNSSSIMSAPTSSGCSGDGDSVGAAPSCGGRAAPILQSSSPDYEDWLTYEVVINTVNAMFRHQWLKCVEHNREPPWRLAVSVPRR